MKCSVKPLQRQDNLVIKALLDLHVFETERSCKRTQLAFNTSKNDLGILVMIAVFDRVLIYEAGSNAELCEPWEPWEIGIDALFE